MRILLLTCLVVGSIGSSRGDTLEAQFHELSEKTVAFEKTCDVYERSLNLALACETGDCPAPKNKSAALRLFRELEKIPETPSSVEEHHTLTLAEKDVVTKATWFQTSRPNENELCAIQRFGNLLDGLIRESRTLNFTDSERKEIRAFVARIVKNEASYPTGLLTQQMALRWMNGLMDAGVYGIPKVLGAELKKTKKEADSLRSQLATEEKTLNLKESKVALLIHDLERVTPLRNKIAELADKL